MLVVLQALRHCCSVQHMLLRRFWKVTVDLLLRLSKDLFELVEHELDDLALEDHVDRHVGVLDLRPEQRGPKHNGDALNRHPVGVFVVDDPETRRGGGKNRRSCGSGSASERLGSPAQVFEKQLHGVVVRQGQRADQVLCVRNPLAVVRKFCTDKRWIQRSVWTHPTQSNTGCSSNTNSL